MNAFKAITADKVKALAARTMSRPAVSFKEEAVVQWVEAFAAERPWVLLAKDADGNLHLSRRGARKTKSPAVFTAHMDHPGFVARKYARRGKSFRVEAEFRGGVEDRYFPGARVRFLPEDVRARVLSVKKDPRTDEKTAVLSAEAAVPSGAMGLWDLVDFRFDEKKGLLWSRAVDDLAGVTAILALFDALPAVDPGKRTDVRAVLTRAEEVGFWGAIGAARARRVPRGAVVISLEASKALPHAPLGGGPILRTGDRASVFNDEVTRSLAAAARRLAGKGKFSWRRALMDGGTCEGTAFQAYGYKTGALCVPLLNYHNMDGKGGIAAEAATLSDLTGLARWMAAWVMERARPVDMKPRLEKMYAAWKMKSLEDRPASG